MADLPPVLQKGVDIIKSYVKTLPAKPGVYRMINERQKVLYVGKAINLKNRVSNYTLPLPLPTRLKRMISETTSMEFVVTESEVEALLLEANLIKRYDPPYNMRLKDDKFFSYIHISDHAYPRLSKYRGAKNEGGTFYGPFVSITAIDHVLLMLHKTFRLRSCTDSYFKGRTRPCLQYHIKRCTAPCVGKISQEDYQKDVKTVNRILSGQSQDVQKDLQDEMTALAKCQNYEQAALIRDQIRALTNVQAKQSVNLPNIKNADVFALAVQGGEACIQGFFYRNGSNYGTTSFFFKETGDQTPEDIFSLFLMQFYTDKCPPSLILSNKDLDDTLSVKALNKLRSQYNKKGKVTLLVPQKGPKHSVVKSVEKNAVAALERKHLSQKSAKDNLARLTAVLELDSLREKTIERIEVYDNSHIQGTNAIGGMIVAGLEGFEKKHYRKFTIKETEITPGDDFGMMKEVLKRRFKGSLSKDQHKSPLPDLVIIDGGKGQLSAAQEIFDAYDIDIPLLAVAKGPERNAGKETFFTKDKPQGFKLDDHKQVLHYLQRLRDEAHRFAITFHRAKREKAMKKSLLDTIPGVGPARKKALLHHFGTAVAVKGASQADLEAVEGISKSLAKHIYSFIHSR